MKVAFIGECMIELKGTMFGEMTQSFGGDTLNSALYLKRVSNAEVYYVTVVGNDTLSSKMVAKWEEEGINTSLVMFDEKRSSGLYMIHLDENGERNFSYWRENSAAKYICSNYMYSENLAALAEMDIVCLSGITLAIIPPENRNYFIDGLEILSSYGVKIMFDSNYRPSLWGSVNSAKETYSRVYAICDHAFVTNDDEMLLWGDVDNESIISRLLKSGVRNVVLKSGADGCYYFGDNSISTIHAPAAKIDKRIDTTSAGDSFNAGFITGIINEKYHIECCNMGNELAAIIIQNNGAIIHKSKTDHLEWK